MLFDLNAKIACILSAELFLLLVRSKDIKTLLKRVTQRTDWENGRVARGMGRSLLLEMIVFIPASAALLLLIAPLITPDHIRAKNESLVAWYALLGIISYGFPFATLKRIAVRVALNTLKEFAMLVPPERNKEEEHTVESELSRELRTDQD